MPSKAAAELRELTDDQLVERAESAKEELFNLRFQLATGQLDNPMRIKDVRHEVARILTVLRERHLAEDTLVVITGDHGQAFGAPHPNYFHSGNVYDEDVRVPFVLWSPGLFKEGRWSDAVGAHVDRADLRVGPHPVGGQRLRDERHRPARAPWRGPAAASACRGSHGRSATPAAGSFQQASSAATSGGLLILTKDAQRFLRGAVGKAEEDSVLQRLVRHRLPRRRDEDVGVPVRIVRADLPRGDAAWSAGRRDQGRRRARRRHSRV